MFRPPVTATLGKKVNHEKETEMKKQMDRVASDTLPVLEDGVEENTSILPEKESEGTFAQKIDLTGGNWARLELSVSCRDLMNRDLLSKVRFRQYCFHIHIAHS
jgi:hypothetical protein